MRGYFLTIPHSAEITNDLKDGEQKSGAPAWYWAASLRGFRLADTDWGFANQAQDNRSAILFFHEHVLAAFRLGALHSKDHIRSSNIVL